MSKFLKTGLILSGIILFGAGCTQYGRNTVDLSDQKTAPESTGPTSVAPEAIVEYVDGMFNPSTIRVLVGTKVTFVNKGEKEVWTASGQHPAHDICPGFDSLRGLKQDETYSHVFDVTAECPFHNHLAPGEKGSIEVKAE